MKMLKVYEDDGSWYRMFIDDKVEYVNPINYFKEISFISSFYRMQDLLADKLKDYPEKIKNEVFYKKLIEDWEAHFVKITEEELDKDFLELLSSKKKNDQLRLLKGKFFNRNSLLKLIFQSFSEFRYTFSRYTSEKLPGNLKQSQLPIIIELNEDQETVTFIGETSLTEGELKNVINHRKKIVANFLDRGNEWHCFYLTYKALAGKESWNSGTPHYHYISDKFGISREKLVEGIKEGKMPSSPIHIGLKNYRDSSEE
ncbi:hypothetical protein [Cognataquiflexum rubidum]|uniref:hypothetical protein n=1 Tax=Cognataquiflexum rubidum TaxID=2922273 RepID=UPI001F14185E|nr:hypothetical protein [Cognataquiflexum rubidum]MCH6235254.1 hypothetical protein [Cognataquiflexum rubidum]